MGLKDMGLGDAEAYLKTLQTMVDDIVGQSEAKDQEVWRIGKPIYVCFTPMHSNTQCYIIIINHY